MKLKLSLEQERKILIGLVLLVMVAATVYRDINSGVLQNKPAAQTDVYAAAEQESAQEVNIKKKVNYVITNNNQFKAVLVDIQTVQHNVYGNTIDVRFQVTNKDKKKPITVRAEEVKVDGQPLDKSTVIMSTEIPAGETSEAILTILEFDDASLPAMEKSFGMILNVFSWEDLSFDENHQFSVAL